MKLKEVLQNIPVVSWNADPETEVTSIFSDSRKIRPGSAFVCLRGQKSDGNEYIPSAFEKGAVVAITETAPQGNDLCVVVEDARSALPILLSNFYHHPEKSFQNLIAITGTNGKTTTSFMLKKIFESCGHKTGLIGTTKYLVGDMEYPVSADAAFLTTPDPELLFELLSAMRDAHCDTVIMEASSHALALKKLAGIRFDCGIFTNLTQDHMDFHKTMEEYLETKKKLFQVSRVGIFNGDDPSYEKMTENAPCRIVNFSAKKVGDYTCREVVEHSDQGIVYRLQSSKGESLVNVPIPGDFTVYNSLAAISCAVELGLEFEKCVSALKDITGVSGRIERVPTDTPFSVFIDFAHTPDALENILKTLRGFTKGRLITLFGCGGDRDRTKRPIMGKIASQRSDFVIVTSDNSRSENPEDIIREITVGMDQDSCPYQVIVSRKEAICYALDHALPGDVILLAGKGHEEYEIDKTGKHSFSEKKIVLEHIGE